MDWHLRRWRLWFLALMKATQQDFLRRGSFSCVRSLVLRSALKRSKVPFSQNKYLQMSKTLWLITCINSSQNENFSLNCKVHLRFAWTGLSRVNILSTSVDKSVGTVAESGERQFSTWETWSEWHSILQGPLFYTWQWNDDQKLVLQDERSPPPQYLSALYTLRRCATGRSPLAAARSPLVFSSAQMCVLRFLESANMSKNAKTDMRRRRAIVRLVLCHFLDSVFLTVAEYALLDWLPAAVSAWSRRQNAWINP